jgi:hypothetical protein
MGALLSRPSCDGFDPNVDCRTIQDQGGHFTSIGGVQKGQFLGDPDTAGIGVSAKAIDCPDSTNGADRGRFHRS